MGRRGRGRNGIYILLHTNRQRYFSQPKSSIHPSSLGEGKNGSRKRGKVGERRGERRGGR